MNVATRHSLIKVCMRALAGNKARPPNQLLYRNTVWKKGAKLLCKYGYHLPLFVQDVCVAANNHSAAYRRQKRDAGSACCRPASNCHRSFDSTSCTYLASNVQERDRPNKNEAHGDDHDLQGIHVGHALRCQPWYSGNGRKGLMNDMTRHQHATVAGAYSSINDAGLAERITACNG